MISEFPLFQASTRLRSRLYIGKDIRKILPPKRNISAGLNEGKYSGGVIILCGLACYRKDRQNLYLVGVDIDKQKGIDEFCTESGKEYSLQDIATANPSRAARGCS